MDCRGVFTTSAMREALCHGIRQEDDSSLLGGGILADPFWVSEVGLGPLPSAPKSTLSSVSPQFS